MEGSGRGGGGGRGDIYRTQRKHVNSYSMDTACTRRYRRCDSHMVQNGTETSDKRRHNVQLLESALPEDTRPLKCSPLYLDYLYLNNFTGWDDKRTSTYI